MSEQSENKYPLGTLNVLIVEDSKIEAKFLANLLKKNGYDVTSACVEREEDMRRELQERDWDIIISDFQMPDFCGMRALETYQSLKLDIPFILVSGKIGEEAAVDLMKRGAHDYIMKGNNARLIPAIKSHLQDAANRRENRRLEKKLRDSEAQYRGFFENAALGIFRCSAQAHLLDVNQQMARTFSYETREACIQGMVKLVPEVLEPGTRTAQAVDLYEQCQRSGHFEALFRRADNSVMEAIVHVWSITDETTGSTYLEGTIEDVTEQREMERRLREMEQMHESLIDLTSNL